MRRHIRPFLIHFRAKFLFEIVPAGLASVAGGLIFAHLGRAPETPKPVAATVQPAGEEMMQLMRDEHALLLDYIKKDTQARLAANRAADEDIVTLRVAAVEAAAHRARLAQAKELAANAEKAERKLTREIKPPIVQLAKDSGSAATPQPARATSEPLQLLAMQHPDIAPARPPADLTASTESARKDGFLKRQVRGVVVAVRQIPEWLGDAADWMTGQTPRASSPSLPALPERNFLQSRL